LRLLRFQRVLSDLETFRQFEVGLFGISPNDVRSWQLQLARVLISIFTLLFVSTGLIYSAEHAVNPQIPDFFTALYFGLTTLTTVGFGDITPVTSNGRFVVSATILAGVAIIPIQAASLVEALLDFDRERNEGKDPKAVVDEKREAYADLLEKVYEQDRCAADDGELTVERTANYAAMLEALYKEDICDAPSEVAPVPEETAVAATFVRTCPTCRTGPQRTDAMFCWSCGSNLPEWGGPEEPS